MEPIRVLQILDSLDYGGVEMFIMNVYRNLDKSKVQFDFLIFKENNCYENEAIALGSKIYKPKIVGADKITRFFNKINYIKKTVENGNYKIVHCHNCAIGGMLNKTIGAKFSKTNSIVIAHSHNTGMPKNMYFDKIIRVFLKELIAYSADYYFACSEKAALSKYPFRKINSSKYYLIHNAINVDQFKFDYQKREELREKLNINDKFVIGNVGRFEKQKNHLFLLSIFKEVLKINKSSALLLVGSGSLEDEIKRKAEDLGITNDIIFCGSLKDVSVMYQCMDVFVLPSKYEGLGIVLIEAQVSGLPCIASNEVPREAKLTELLSFKELDEDSKEWAKAILKNRDSFVRENKGKKISEEGYDIFKEVKKLENFYLIQSRC